ncbi:MAG: hypothetical protein AAF830_09005 [Pseudomonadota bacterium]
MNGKSVLSIVVAIVVGVAVRGFFASDLNPFGNAGAPTASQIESELLARSEMFVIIKENFPGEFDALIADVSAAAADGIPAVEAASAAATSALRIKYAERAYAADDEDLRTMMRAVAQTHRTVEDLLGAATCGAFALQGVPAIQDQMRPGTPVYRAVEAQSIATMKVLASGKDKPPRQQASDEDFAALFDYANLSAEDQAKVDRVGATDPSDPLYCQALVWYIERVANSDVEAAGHVRAFFAYTLASN